MPATFPLSIDERKELLRNREYEIGEVQDGWSTYLNRWNWKYFLTVTFKEPKQPHMADTTLQNIARVFKSRSDGRLFLGTEIHISRTLHVHGLFSPKTTSNDVSARVAHEIWRDLYDKFGRSQVRKVRSSEAVSDYVSKYVTKELTEWYMST